MMLNILQQLKSTRKFEFYFVCYWVSAKMCFTIEFLVKKCLGHLSHWHCSNSKARNYFNFLNIFCNHKGKKCEFVEIKCDEWHHTKFHIGHSKADDSTAATDALLLCSSNNIKMVVDIWYITFWNGVKGINQDIIWTSVLL